MPAANADLEAPLQSESQARLPFPPVKRSHILHCSFHFWYPKYRSLTPKARIIPLPSAFLEYLRSDGIILPSEDDSQQLSCDEADEDSWSCSANPMSTETEDNESDPSSAWLDLHNDVKDKISELGGSVVPKLNWSAPKDATWISATNDMECRTPNDIYLLLKSSDFITHDLEHAFDDCEYDSESDNSNPNEASDVGLSRQSQNVPYHLVLRKTIPMIATSLEFRCFVQNRRLLCICQRDLNYFPFLSALIPSIRSLIQQLFDVHLKSTFPDEEFVFDVYIPPSQTKAWLIDINPWAPRTDPLLFSWLELLGAEGEGQQGMSIDIEDDHTENSDENNIKDDVVDQECMPVPEIRLVERNDPEAYNFNSPQYSAHKLPKDLVDASVNGEAGLAEFMGRWREIMARQEAAATSNDE